MREDVVYETVNYRRLRYQTQFFDVDDPARGWCTSRSFKTKFFAKRAAKEWAKDFTGDRVRVVDRG